MRLSAVVGPNWGDEGKGRMVDLLTEDCDAVVRYQGGGNAGHTVEKTSWANLRCTCCPRACSARVERPGSRRGAGLPKSPGGDGGAAPRRSLHKS